MKKPLSIILDIDPAIVAAATKRAAELGLSWDLYIQGLITADYRRVKGAQ